MKPGFYQPQRMAVVATDTATNTAGQQITTAKVQNAAQSTSELKLTLQNTSGARITNISIFDGYKKGADLLTKFGNAGQQGVPGVLTADGFATVQEFINYFENAKTIIEGFSMETNNTGNYAQFIRQLEKYPDGSDADARFKLQDYRNSLGGGTYENDIKVPAEDFRAVLSRYLTLSLDYLEPNSTLTIYFNIGGIDKSAELSPIPTKSI